MSKTFKKFIPILLIALMIYIVLIAVTRGQTATGGQFMLEKSVIAGGGGEKGEPPTGEHGTTGQSVAGHRSTGGQFLLRSGFWTPDAELLPTAGRATVSGRVITSEGRGIVNAKVHMISPSGEVLTAATSSFGYFKFTEVPVGDGYILSVQSKRFTFAISAYVVQVMDDVTGIVFRANP